MTIYSFLSENNFWRFLPWFISGFGQKDFFSFFFFLIILIETLGFFATYSLLWLQIIGKILEEKFDNV